MALTASHVSVTLGRKPIVQDVSFSLSDGQWLMLTGPNGAGKSTLVGAVSQSLAHTGVITLDGVPLRSMKPAVLAKRIGVLSQQSSMPYAFTVEEVVRMGRYAHRQGFLAQDPDGEPAVEAALDAVGLSALRAQSMLTLSGGERQRAFLAQVLCQQPDILILDEPANHLDLSYQKQLFDLIDSWRTASGHAVISVVHDLSLALRYGTHALLLYEGHGTYGRMRDVLTPDSLQAVWGMDVQGFMQELFRAWMA